MYHYYDSPISRACYCSLSRPIHLATLRSTHFRHGGFALNQHVPVEGSQNSRAHFFENCHTPAKVFARHGWAGDEAHHVLLFVGQYTTICTINTNQRRTGRIVQGCTVVLKNNY